MTSQTLDALKKYLGEQGQTLDAELKNPLHDTGVSFHLKVYGVKECSNKIYSNFIPWSVCITKKKDGTSVASI